MQKTALTLAALLCLALVCGAHAQAASQAQSAAGSVNIRYSEQVSNAPPGTCGCFGLEGVAGDVAWVPSLGLHGAGVGVAADLGVVHTGQVAGGNYGLTLTTITAGPRLRLPGKRLQPFVQALLGYAHGSSSQFPSGNTLVSSASSFAVDLGGGLDYALNNHRVSIRVLQLDYLRTSLPNIYNGYQNNLRIGVGVTMHLGSLRKH